MDNNKIGIQLQVIIITVLLFLIPTNCYAQLKSGVSSWEFWPTTEFIKPVSDNFKGKLSIGAHFNGNNYYYNKIDLGVFNDSNPKFEYGYGLGNARDKSEGKWRVEYQPYVYIKPKWEIKKFRFSDKALLEYRIFLTGKHSYPRFRNKFTIAYPIKLKKLNLEFLPYVAQEIFVFAKDGGRAKISSNRLYYGAKYDLSESTQIDVYQMKQMNGSPYDRESETDIFNAMGLTLTFKL